MKLSDVKGEERVFSVLVDLVDPIASIASDPDASRLFKKEKLPEGKTVNQFMLEKLQASIPPLLKGHKNDIITILSTIEGTDRKEYSENLTIAKLINDCFEILTDEEFLGLFTSAQSGKADSTSISARENTGEKKD